MEDFLGIIFFVVFLGVTYVIGKSIESKHYSSLIKEEAEFSNLPAVTSKKIEQGNVLDSTLVVGSVVISGDYFKKVLAGLLNFFGGRIVSYETLIDRARRESLIRMKKQAKIFNADMVLNVRFETTKLDSMTTNQGTGMFELIAYGTAVRLKK